MELENRNIPGFASVRHKALAPPGNPSVLHSDQGTNPGSILRYVVHMVLHNKYCIWQSTVRSKE